MSFCFGHNLFLVRMFHTMKKIVKMCQFYSDSSRFLATNCKYYSGHGILANIF
jgi:hypothetical protein